MAVAPRSWLRFACAPLFVSCLGAVALAPRTSHAAVDVAAVAGSGLPLGANQETAQGSLNGRLALRIYSPDGRLFFGAVGGVESQRFSRPWVTNSNGVGSKVSTIQSAMFGGTIGRWLGSTEWNPRGYVQLDVGYARLTNNDNLFAEQKFLSNTGAVWIVPRAGLVAAFTKHFGMQIGAHWEQFFNQDYFTLGDWRTKVISNFGLELGFTLTL